MAANQIGVVSMLNFRRLLMLLVCFMFSLLRSYGSYITGPTGPSPITPSLGTPKFVQAAEAHTTTGPSSFTVNFGSLPAVGDVVIAYTLIQSSGSPANDQTLVVTDNQGGGNGNGYARLQIAAGSSNAAAAVPRISMWCAPVTTSGGTFTITVASSSGMASPGLMALEYSGTSCNMDKFAIAQGATSPYSCGSVTTINPKDLILAAIQASGSTGTVTFTGPTGFTIRESQTDSTVGTVGAIADDIVSAVNTFAPTYGTGQNHSQTPCAVVALLSQ